MSRYATGYLCLLVVALAACSFDEHANGARGCDEQCAPGSCYLGFCLQMADAPAAGAQGASGTSPTSSGTTAGSDGTAGVTASGGTTATGSGGSAAPISGSGGASGPPSCASGMPRVETCNGLDDDCDGVLDEDASVSCYPTGVTGCALDAAGAYACTGLCAPGTQTCTNGSLSACTGAVQPKPEQCGGTEALDEDCDGTVDDDCPCQGAATQRCYSGRAFSAGIGICKSGTQRCVNGVFGSCEGEVIPTTESCANQGHDDDCDFVIDDVLGAGATCFDFAQLGVCGVGQRACSGGVLVCNTPDAEADETSCDGRDEDCDGSVDENFDLDRDPDNCGGCGIRCDAGALCCGGSCHDPKTDAQNCGVCGHSCGDDKTCCGGGCVLTNTPEHCGGCNACDGDELCCGGDCVGGSGDGGVSCP